MGRPAFSLTDDQARQLAELVDALNVACPRDGASHRAFVRGFLAAVHQATGKLYSPATYRRLLGAYAPERTPSTVTLADERRRLAERLSVSSHVDYAVTGDPADGHADLLHLMRAVVADALQATGAAARGASTGSAELAFLRARLEEAEGALRQFRAQVSESTAQLAAAQQSAVQYQAQAQTLEKTLAEQAAAIALLAAASDDARKFALLAIDEARGETRVWKERCLSLEGQRQLDARLLETFRQAAYRAGAQIPESLRKDNA